MNGAVVSRNSSNKSWTVKKRVEKDIDWQRQGQTNRQIEKGGQRRRADGDHYIGSRERQRVVQRVSNDFWHRRARAEGRARAASERSEWTARRQCMSTPVVVNLLIALTDVLDSETRESRYATPSWTSRLPHGTSFINMSLVLNYRNRQVQPYNPVALLKWHLCLLH